MAPSRQGPRKPAPPRSARSREADRGGTTDNVPSGGPGQAGNVTPSGNGSPSDNSGAAGNGQRDANGKSHREPSGDVPTDATVADGVPALPADGIGLSRGTKGRDTGLQAKLGSAAKPGTATSGPANGAP